MNDVLPYRITELLEDNILYFWHGSIFTNKNKYPRIDKTYLYVLHNYYHSPCIQRLIGYKDIEDPDNPYIRYSLTPLYRITEGPKNGWCLPEQFIPEHVDRVPAYINKYVRKGKARDQLNSARSLDEFLLEMLSEPKILEELPRDELLVPNIYLAARKSSFDLYSRNSTAPEDAVIGSQGSKNFYDYREIYGRGVLVSDPEYFMTWYRTPKYNLVRDEPHIYVNLNKYVEDEELL